MSTTTTGSNSNTSGNSVATVKFWPKGILPAIQDLIASLGATVARIKSGDETAADFDFVLKGSSDQIADVVMAEISRRSIITFSQEDPGNVVFSPTEPDDHTKAWWQTDPTTGIPLGQPKTWDDGTKQWVEIAPNAAAYTPPDTRNGTIYSPPGNSDGTFNFADIKTTDFAVSLTPTSFYNGTFYPAPATIGATYSYILTGRTATSITVHFYGIPNVNTSQAPVGVTWEVKITANPEVAA